MNRLDALLRAVPHYDSFLSADEMRQRWQALLNRYPGLFRARTVGQSRDGRTIELLSAGHGGPAVMLVGAPHPHELVGTLTIDFLAHYIAEQPMAQSELGCSWHFIQVIEPDGLYLNEPWIARPRRPSNYLRSFYRPPLSEQAEYTFPFSTRDHSFGMTTPEANAWRTALDWVRPDLLVSLHNSEVGGAFFFTSGDDFELDSSLVECAGRLGFDIDARGEPGSLPKAGRPGVFRFPDEIEQSILDAGESGAPLSLLTGDSSAGYAQRQFGTLSLVPEVPYWRLPEGKPAAMLAQRPTTDALVNALLPRIDRSALSAGTARLLRALEDDVAIAATDATAAAVEVSQSLVSMRRPAMLFNLASRLGQQEIVDAIEPQFDAWCQALDGVLEPIPLVQLVRLQAASAWLAAQRMQARQAT